MLYCINIQNFILLHPTSQGHTKKAHSLNFISLICTYMPSLIRKILAKT
jgi:hypothetical protein